jgi:YbbR domain-containing protein
MRRLGDGRVLYGLLSLGIATVMWLYVAIGQNPQVERPMNVDLHVRGLSTTEVVVQAPSRVQVRVQGPRSAVAALTPSLLDAFVDLSGLRPGEHRVPVYVLTPPDVRVLDRAPAEALVVLDTLIERRLPVEVSLTGTPPEGVTLGQPRVAPDHVVVSGPASQVDEVRHALVTLDTEQLRQQVVTSLPVHLEDVNGQEVRGLTVDPSVVEAALPVREGVITKVVPIVPTIVGTPRAPLTVTGITTNPATVTLTGSGALLKDVHSVTTAPVDVSKASRDLAPRAALVLPSGISAPVREVAVVVRIGRTLLSTILRAVPVRVVGVPAGAVSRVSPDTVEVQVEGPQDLLEHLTVQAVTIEVDAAGQRPGEHKLTPRAVLPRGIHLLAIRPANIVVIIRVS